jgi:alpha-methylacyl-CoA racemase
LNEKLVAIFKTKTRAEWCRLMEGSDVCFAPVLSISEAPDYPQAKARDSYIDVAGVIQPAPAPRFSRTPPKVRGAACARGTHTDEVLGEAGFSAGELKELRESGAIA